MDGFALVLAAGAGRRMESDTPKVLHKINGRTLADYVLEALDPVCSRKVMIVKHKMDEVMHACAGKAEFVEQKDGGWGTGWAVISAREFLEGYNGRVIITAGDMPLVKTQTFAKLDRAVADGYDAAMLYDTVENPHGYGRMVCDNAGMPCAIVEQKELSKEQLAIAEINASVYCFNAQSLLSALDTLGCENASNEYYLTDVIAALYKNGKRIIAIPVEESSECLGINTKAQLEEAGHAMAARCEVR